MPSWPALKSSGLPAMLTFWARTGKSACFHFFGPLVLLATMAEILHSVVRKPFSGQYFKIVVFYISFITFRYNFSVHV